MSKTQVIHNMPDTISHHISNVIKASNVYDALLALDSVLMKKGGCVNRSCVRTWIYLKDIAKDYTQMVCDRRRFFDEAGLVDRYIASTGIQIDDLTSPITMVAQSLIGIDESDIMYLNGGSKMSHPAEYGVTFERGTRITLPDTYKYFISGTASIDRFGKSLHVGDVKAQLTRTMENIKEVLKSGDAKISDIDDIIVYLKDLRDADMVASMLSEYKLNCDIEIMHGVVCRPEWLIEIECTASRVR